MSYTRKAALGIGTIILLHLGAALFGYLFRVILARHYGVESYGLFFSVLAFFYLFSTVKDLGLGNALVITIPKILLRKKWDELKTYLAITYGFKLIMAGILALILFFLAPFLSGWLFKTTNAVSLLRIMAVVFFLGANEEILISTFLGFQKHTYFACIELFKKILLVVFLFFFLNYGLNAPALAYLAAAVLLPFTLLPFLAKTYNPLKDNTSFSMQRLTFLLLLGLPFVLNTLTYSVVSYFDTLLLTKIRSLTEVGLYNAALPIAMTLLQFMYAFDYVLQPLASELYHAKKKEKLVLGLRLLHRYLFAGLLLCLIILASFAPLLFQVLYGSAFVSAATAFQILLLGVLCYAIALTHLSVLNGIGKPKVVAKIMIFAAVLNIIFNLFLIPRYGMNGAALATTISYAFTLFASYYSLRKHLTLQPPWSAWAKTLLVSLVLSAAAWKAQAVLNWNLWIGTPVLIILIALIYMAFVFGMGIVSWPEMKVLWKDLVQR